jgi:hypothetical protein
MKGPNGEQIRKAERNGVVLWKEIRIIVHIRQAVGDGCKCSRCEAAGSISDSVTPEQAASAENVRTPAAKSEKTN